MNEVGNPIPEWRRQDLPPLLSRRFEFVGYDETRAFLDAVARISETLQLYPNMSFGKTYASVTIDRGGEPIGAEEIELARKIDGLAAGTD